MIKIDEKMQDINIYSTIKMLLLQNSKQVQQKVPLPSSATFVCQNKRCKEGWFDTPAPTGIYASSFQWFNAA
jgi:hypothetical protein